VYYCYYYYYYYHYHYHHYCLIPYVCRLTCSLIYYALALNTGALHGDIYINAFVSGALEIPAYIVCVLMMNSKLLGRRWTGAVGLIGSGISCFLCIPLILSGEQFCYLLTIKIIFND